MIQSWRLQPNVTTPGLSNADTSLDIVCKRAETSASPLWEMCILVVPNTMRWAMVIAALARTC